MKLFAIAMLAAATCYSISSFAQTGSATANGACSIASSGSHTSTLTITCGIGKEQGQKIIDMLNHLLSNKDTAAINAKLDALLKVAKHPLEAEVLNCTGSNCVQNGTQTNIDQRRFGELQPPPKLLNLSQKNVDPVGGDTNKPGMEGPASANPGISVSFSVDRPFQNPMFLVLCDRPCVTTSAMVTGASSPKMLGVSNNPQIAGVSLGLMGDLFPGNPVTITVRSADSKPIRVIDAEAYIPPIRP